MHPTDDATLKSMILEMTLYITTLMTEHKITWWVDEGNLLGLVRNDTLMVQGDIDMDIAVLGTDDTKLASLQEQVHNDNYTLIIGNFGGIYKDPRRLARLFYLPFEPAAQPDRTLECFGTAAPVHMDLFFWDVVDSNSPKSIQNRALLYTQDTRYGRNRTLPPGAVLLARREPAPANPLTQDFMRRDHLFPLGTMNAHEINRQVFVPKEPVIRLVDEYGSDWMVPKTHAEVYEGTWLGGEGFCTFTCAPWCPPRLYGHTAAAEEAGSEEEDS